MWVRFAIALLLLCLVALPLLGSLGGTANNWLALGAMGLAGLILVMMPVEILIAVGALFCAQFRKRAA